MKKPPKALDRIATTPRRPRGEETVSKKQPHSFTRKVVCGPWFYCSRCGLLRLRNAATDAAVKRGCADE